MNRTDQSPRPHPTPEPQAKLPCPAACTTGQVEPSYDEDTGCWDATCTHCQGDGWAHELECAGCDRVESILCGQDPNPHACDPENPLSYLCGSCRLAPEHHHLRCLGGGVLRRVA